MTNSTRVHTAGLVLICGGLIAIGAFAGLRVAFGTTTHILTCTPVSGDPCIQLLSEFNRLAQIFGAGGVVAIGCGGLAMWSQRDVEESA